MEDQGRGARGSWWTGVMRARPSPSMVVALIALLVALSGSAVAVTNSKKVKLPKNSVGSKQIKKGAVQESDLADDAVTEPKIAANAVTEPKIAAGAVTSSDLAGSAVTEQKIAPDAVGAPSVKSGILSTAKFKDSVTAPTIQDGSVSDVEFSQSIPVVKAVDDDGYATDPQAGLFPSAGLPTFAEEVDTDGMFPSTLLSGGFGSLDGTDRFEVKTAGVYSLTFTASWAADNEVGERSTYIRRFKPGVGIPEPIAYVTDADATGASVLTQTASGVATLAAGDVIEAITFARLTDTHSTSVVDAPVPPTFTATWVSPG